jgi:superfamily II DNA or RNA helicase
MGFHTSGEPETIESLIEMPDGSVHVPRGSVDVVREVFLRDGVRWSVDDDARSNGSAIWIDDVPDPVPCRDYQKEGVYKIAKFLQGMIVLPCGTGKSRLGVAAIRAVNRTALVTVPTEDLVDQWCASLRELLGVEAGRVGGGKSDWNADVVVGIPNSLVPLLESDPTIGLRFGFVIVDEAHRAPAVTYRRLLRLLPARWRLGLTATPTREDGLELLMHWAFGSTLLDRTTQDMIRLGYLQRAEIDIVETGWTFSYTGPEAKRVAAMERALAEDLSRSALVADRVARDARAGESVLVLANRKGMVRELTDMLAARGVGVVGVTGETSKKKRKGAIATLRSGDLSVMVATSLADEGLDVQRLSRIHLAYPQKARGATLQRLGRILRLFPGKKPRLVDYVDRGVPTLARRSDERMRVYRAAGLLP